MIPIPPIALKALGVVAALAIAAGMGYVKGREDVQESWDAALTVQTRKTVSQIIAEATNGSDAVVKLIEVRGETTTRIKVVEKRVVEYEQSPVQRCAVDADFVSIWDDARRVYNTGLPRLRPTIPGASEPDELPGGAAPASEFIRSDTEPR